MSVRVARRVEHDARARTSLIAPSGHFGSETVAQEKGSCSKTLSLSPFVDLHSIPTP